MAKIAAQNLPGRGTAMRQSRLALLAGSLLIGLCADAAAQMITQPPMQMPGQPPMQVPGQPPQGAPPCMTAFLPLRSEAERRAETLKSAVAHKVTPDKLCPLFKSFSETLGAQSRRGARHPDPADSGDDHDRWRHPRHPDR